MIQGATSDAGKSALVTGICRLLQRNGYRVAPFKPQNMALNSAVTIDGGEIGRAQAVQAQASGIEPHTDMNPILLKPNTDTGAQVIINGHPVGDMDARSYHAFKPKAMSAVLAAYERLKKNYDVVLVEGAGSPAEINLRDKDVANMGFAEAIDCPVLIMADIDRGGVFAHLVGTLELLSQSEQDRVQGFVINKFRGDVGLLTPGNDWLTQRTGKPVVGVLPFLKGLYLEAEDGLSQQWSGVENHQAAEGSGAPESDQRLKVVVPVPPRISNHTDFDPLRLHPSVDFSFVRQGEALPSADLIILPGSKTVSADLIWLREQGWEQAIQKHLRYGGKLLGICGGFQMLGQAIIDPDKVEGDRESIQGLGLLDFTTTLYPQKQLHRVEGTLALDTAGKLSPSAVIGYEIHAGLSKGRALDKPLVRLNDRNDGAISDDLQVAGTYLHGIFEAPEACEALLAWAGLSNKAPVMDFNRIREAGINTMADAVEDSIGLSMLLKLLAIESMPSKAL